MLFGNCRGNMTVQLEIDGVEIERVTQNKFLGITIDDKLSWKSHIKHVRTKISKSISILNKAKQFLDHKSLRTLYCSLVLPYLSYCAEVWGNTYKSSLHSLSVLQKRAIRIIHKVGYLDHTTPLFLRSHLLKFSEIVEYQTAIIMFKAIHNLLPANIQKLFRGRDGGYNLRGEFKLKTLAVRTTVRTFSISICGVKLWNSLPVELKQCLNVGHFKRKYKDGIFTKYRIEDGP